MKDVFDHAQNIWMPNGTLVENQDTLQRSMTYKIIRNMLTADACRAIHTKSSQFMFGEHGDGTCFFKAIVVKVKSSTTMSIKALKKKLCLLNLKDFAHDVKIGNFTFDKTVQEIKRKGEDIKDNDIFIDLFAFWQTSTNEHFK